MAAAICLSACNDDDKNNNQSDAVECLELTASTTDIELDGDRLDDVVLTFEWTPAREMPEEYMISYVTKIDIEGSNFNSCVRNDEAVSYTHLDVYKRQILALCLKKKLLITGKLLTYRW